MVGRQTEEPENNLRLAIFEVEDVSCRFEIYYCPCQGVLGLSQSATLAQRRANCPRCRALDFEPEVQDLLVSCNRTIDRLCPRNTDGIPWEVHSYKAGTYFDFEHDSGIAAMLEKLSISRNRTRHGDEEVDTVFGVSTVGLPYGIDGLRVGNREGTRG